MLIEGTGAYPMHKWGSPTNGPQGIWSNRGYGSQHVFHTTVLLCTILYYQTMPHYILPVLVCHTMPYYSINTDPRVTKVPCDDWIRPNNMIGMQKQTRPTRIHRTT